jgi:hypothetical protein
MPKITAYLTIIATLIASISTAAAEFRKVGPGSLDTVRSADIRPSCSYRLKANLAATKVVSYALDFARQSATTSTPPAFSYQIEGALSYAQLLELNGVSPSVYVSSKPSPSATPSVNTGDEIRVEISATTPGKVQIISRGSSFNLIASFFNLEAECGSVDTLPISSFMPSASCPGLTVSFRSPNGVLSPCECPYSYNDMTSGSQTPCGYIPPAGQQQDGRLALCNDGRFGPVSSTSCTGGMASKYIGPVGSGLSTAYVFDFRSCSCKLCDPSYYKRSADLRSCECRFQSANDLKAFRETPPAEPMPTTSFNDSCGSLRWDSQLQRNVWTFNPGVIFDNKTCTCTRCPSPRYSNADSTACLP